MAAQVPSAKELAWMFEHKKDSKMTLILVVNSVFVTLSIFVVALRIISRRISHQRLAADDWLVVAALVIYVPFVVVFCVSTKYGEGRHLIFAIKNPRMLGIFELTDECIYAACLALIKFSLLYLYYRIFPQKWFKIVLAVLAAFTACWSATTLLIAILQCIPVQAVWNPFIKDPTCIDTKSAVYATGSMNILTDFAILGLPIPLIWQLQVTVQKKRLLTFTFIIGGMACIISIIRLVYAGTFTASTDTTWDNVPGLVLSSVEIGTGILAACCPTYRPLFKHFTKRRSKSSSKPPKSSVSYPTEQSSNTSRSLEVQYIDRREGRKSFPGNDIMKWLAVEEAEGNIPHSARAYMHAGRMECNY